MDFVKVDQLLDELYPQMEEDLQGLLAFASLKAEPQPGAPFGQAIADALAYCLQMSERLGLTTGNVDGYVGYADLPGATPEQVGVLSHIDIVPVNAPDWTHPPFAGVVDQDEIYGRGTLDDKGPLVASLYAGIALQKAGIPLSKTVRFLYGCDEESGFSCIKYYLTKHDPPSWGFSPDAKFPLVVGEKGLGQYQLAASWQPCAGEAGAVPVLLSMQAGQATNVVPDKAYATFRAPADSALAGLDKLPDIEVESADGQVVICAHGKAGHASCPDEGDNALAKLFEALTRVDFYPEGAKQYVDTLARLFAESGYGETLGVADRDEISFLTNVPSVITLDGTGGTLTCDMRFPVTRHAADIEAKLLAICAENGLRLENWKGTEPMYAGADSELARRLLKAYRDYTGDDTEPSIEGGGTYAKCVPNFLAFGPSYPGGQLLAHQADERIGRKHFLDIAKIYARAIYELAQ